MLRSEQGSKQSVCGCQDYVKDTGNESLKSCHQNKGLKLRGVVIVLSIFVVQDCYVEILRGWRNQANI